MKKFNKNPKDFRKEPLSFEEHEELAKDLKMAQQILEPWMDRFYHAYSVNGKECKHLHNVLNLLSSKICNDQDNHWYTLPTDSLSEDDPNRAHNSPYYGKGKVAW